MDDIMIHNRFYDYFFANNSYFCWRSGVVNPPAKHQALLFLSAWYELMALL
ncbi:MAG: hypothetical protein ACJASU_000326 [Cognaticolwellia sp.]|jgi:hypothetical protein